MDAVLALAIVMLGAFLIVVATAVFYFLTVRPRLLSPIGRLDDELQAELTKQRDVAQQLNTSLAHHAEVLYEAAGAIFPEKLLDGFRDVLDRQNNAVTTLTELFSMQAQTLDNVNGQLTGQEDNLARLEAKLDAIPRLDQDQLLEMIKEQGERLDSIRHRFDDWIVNRAKMEGDLNDNILEHSRILASLDRDLASQAEAIQLLDAELRENAALLNSATEDRQHQTNQLDHLVDQVGQITPSLSAILTTQEDEADRQWAEKLDEHSRLLADLDREVSAQADSVREIDGKVGAINAKVLDHTLRMDHASEERQQQTSLLEHILDKLARMTPILNQLLTAPPRAGQDRLTDIRGIGPVYAGRLYEAGIHTFRQLAAMTPEEIVALMNEPRWRSRSIKADQWIEQAGLLASQREKVEQIT
jgi:predicted flap endonuclease-1-like 5' DNA nuclease/uncharacterized coiled-coil protein SlyX